MIFGPVNPRNPHRKILDTSNFKCTCVWLATGAAFCHILNDVGFEGLYELNPSISTYAARTLSGAFSFNRAHGAPRHLFSLFFQAMCGKSRTSRSM